MKVRYIGARPREVAPQGVDSFIVTPGQEIDVAVPLAVSLLDQPQWFEKVEKPEKKEKEE